MKSRLGVLAVLLAASTMLAAVGLVATGGWLISSAALMPPILVLQVAIVAVRFFGIARGAARWGERVVSHEVALTGTTRQRVALWNAAAVLGPRGIWRLRGSDALDRLTADSDALQDDVTRVRTPFIAAALSAALLVVLQFTNLAAAGVALALAFIVAGVVVPLATVRIERDIAQASVRARNSLSQHIDTVVNHSDDLRLLGMTDSYLALVDAADRERVSVESAASRWAGLSSLLTGIATGLALFSGLAAGIASYSRDQLDGPMIAVIALLPWASAEIMSTFAQATTARTRVEVSRQRIERVLADAQHRAANHPVPTVTLEAPRALRLRSVAVRWDDVDVVPDVSFDLERGRSLALVGPSGSGKSSIASAVLGLVEYRGSIALDGIEIGQVLDYSRHVTAMLQTTHVFATSVRENLKLASPRATDVQLMQALEDAGLMPWFETLIDGLDTRIGDGERGMSGGEIQRLGIARVLLTSAGFVVLDEPTEHLDSETAEAVWKTLRTTFSDRGLLVITHDERVAAHCDGQVRLA